MIISIVMMGILLCPMAFNQSEEIFIWPDLIVENIELDSQCVIVITIKNDGGTINSDLHRGCAVKVIYEGKIEEFYLGMTSS